MRFDLILAWMEANAEIPAGSYSFATTTQQVLVRKPGENQKVEYEVIPILDSHDAIIWNDLIIAKPTSAECDIAWAEMQKEISDAEDLAAQRQDDIEQSRLAYPDEIADANAVTLLQLTERIMWLEKEIRDLRGL